MMQFEPTYMDAEICYSLRSKLMRNIIIQQYSRQPLNLLIGDEK